MQNTNSKYIQKHPFHLVDPSPWPLITSFNLLGLVLGGVLFMNRYHGGYECLVFHLFFVTLSLILWWRDVIREATFEGHHTSYVQLGLKMGMILFILTEVMFFFAFFWSFFHSSLNPSIGIGCQWPPKGITTIDPWGVPLLNTVILLSSGVTITWSHAALIYGNFDRTIQGLSWTILFGVFFSYLQYTEYVNAPFGLTDGIFGTVFFMLTGFHGFHVIIGTIFLIVCFSRTWKRHFSRTHHLGFEAAAWYWHFVDVVWIFVFLFVYVWGGNA